MYDNPSAAITAHNQLVKGRDALKKALGELVAHYNALIQQNFTVAIDRYGLYKVYRLRGVHNEKMQDHRFVLGCDQLAKNLHELDVQVAAAENLLEPE